MARVSEHDPLLPKKPFHRARPLWLVPFAITASVVRGMTVAPRVQVFTQLSCNQLYHHQSHNISDYPPLLSFNDHTLYSDSAGPYHLLAFDSIVTPSASSCSSDPAVQSRTARLQTMMTTTMGVMSALTTGWWGHFGERHGRTRVLIASTTGLLVSDLVFYFVSIPNSSWARHAHILFVIVAFFEGLLGGGSTLQAATSAYISDCTSDGSRAQIFSRMTGVLSLGVAAGPAIGAFLMHHPLFSSTAAHRYSSTTSVFEVAVLCSCVNLLLLFISPESLNAKRAEEVPVSDSHKHESGFFSSLFGPLAIFAPKIRTLSHGGKRRDWNPFLLACGLFAALFSMGVFQVKYLYAQHIYGWGAEQLSYYISLIGALRATHLLVIMPFIISKFKPKSTPAPASGPKPKPSPEQVVRGIKFDLIILRLSLMVDLLSHTLVVLSSQGSNPLLFIAYTSLPTFGSGSFPAANSLALSMMKADGDTGTGKLFGAFAMLHAIAQMILGPLAFGLVYSITVARYPKTIFVMAGSTCLIALLCIFLIRPKADKQKGRARPDIERGRPRASKDLRSGLVDNASA